MLSGYCINQALMVLYGVAGALRLGGRDPKRRRTMPEAAVMGLTSEGGPGKQACGPELILHAAVCHQKWMKSIELLMKQPW